MLISQGRQDITVFMYLLSHLFENLLFTDKSVPLLLLTCYDPGVQTPHCYETRKKILRGTVNTQVYSIHCIIPTKHSSLFSLHPTEEDLLRMEDML